MIELWDSLAQLLAAAFGFCAALRRYYRSRRQPWFLLACFYGTFSLGTLYWALHLLLRQETPQIFYVADLAWLASFVFLLALTLTLPTAEERRFRTGLCWLVPAVCLPQFVLYVTHGDVLSNILMCGMTMLLACCAVRGLVFAKRRGGAAAAPVPSGGAGLCGAGICPLDLLLLLDQRYALQPLFLV